MTDTLYEDLRTFMAKSRRLRGN